METSAGHLATHQQPPAEAPHSSSSFRYVYAIVDAGAPLPVNLVGFGDAALATVRWCALAAVTTCVDSAFRPSMAEHLLRHEAVVEGLRQSGRTLPVRFGTVLRDQAAVEKALAERYDVLVADLTRLWDKVEMGVTVLWDGEVVPDEADVFLKFSSPTEQAVDSVASPSSGTADDGGEPGPGARYLLARLAEHRRDSLLRRGATTLARELDADLRRHALATRSRVLPTQRLAFDAAYLLAPNSLAAFGETLDRLRQTHPSLRFLLSGPWPPYSFVTPPRDNPGILSAS